MLDGARFPRAPTSSATRGAAHAGPGRAQPDRCRPGRPGVDRAGTQLRHGAILAGYSGLEHKEFAFALALILDELGRHIRDLDENLRASVVERCREITALAPGSG
jgi:hypothetical protein